MRYEPSSFRVLALLTAVAVFTACGGQETPATEEAAPAEAAPPPAPDSYTLVAKDGAWNADIAPSGVVFRQRRDSLMFEFKPPTMNGAISDYDVLTSGGADTVRLTVSMAMTECTDNQGNKYTHMAHVWLTGDRTLTAQGCANKKP